MKTLALLPLTFVGSSSAAILSLGSYTKTTDGNETFSQVFNGGTQMFQFTSGDVYVVYDWTVTNPTNPGTLDTTESYGGYSHSGSDLFGQNWQQSKVGVVYYGQRDDVADVSIVLGTPLTMVVKYELNGVGVDGDTIKFWVNPILGTGVEGAPDDADPGRIWNLAEISSDNMQFRRGNSSENTLEFSNIRVFSDGASPFAVIPEPASLTLSGLALLGLLRRRR